MELQRYSGWWFGCHLDNFPINIGFLIIPIDELIFFRGVFPQPPTSIFHYFSWLSIIHWPPQGIRPLTYAAGNDFDEVCLTLIAGSADVRAQVGAKEAGERGAPRGPLFPQDSWGSSWDINGYLGKMVLLWEDGRLYGKMGDSMENEWDIYMIYIEK